METITIEKLNVLKAYKEASESEKKLLINLVPELLLVPKKRWQDLVTWELVCESANIHPVNDLPYPNPISDKQEGQNAFFQYTTIREELNEGKDADWANSSESKWALWPNVIEDKSKPSGFGLSWRDYDSTSTSTNVGSRLSFNEKAKAKHLWDYFLPVVEKFMLISKK